MIRYETYCKIHDYSHRHGLKVSQIAQEARAGYQNRRQVDQRQIVCPASIHTAP